MSALSTVLYLVREGLDDRQVLIIDRSEKVNNDRTWCYWTKNDHPFPEIVHKSWNQLSFFDDKGQISSAMRSYTYNMVKSIDFYSHVKEEISTYKNVTFHYGDVQGIQEEEDFVKVWVGDEWFSGKQVFNSIVNLSQFSPEGNEYFLYQHFMGWFLETDEHIFDPNDAVLMDFRTPQEGDARFFYVLPFSTNSALVEFTVFSNSLLTDKAYRIALSEYIKNHLGTEHFFIKEEEFGVIPMTNIKLGTWEGKRIHHIGTAAGQVKPTTGYAFINILNESKALASHILDKPNSTSRKRKRRFEFYDNLLLHILTYDGQQAKKIFSALFRNNPIYRILDFLSERSHLLQEAMIFSRIPNPPFIKALFARSLYQLKLFSKLNWKEKKLRNYYSRK